MQEGSDKTQFQKTQTQSVLTPVHSAFTCVSSVLTFSRSGWHVKYSVFEV